MNSYQILGVKPGASKQEITAAFRKKAKECHPDINRHDLTLERKFKELNDAYRKLLENLDEAPASERPSTHSYRSSPRRVNSIKEIHLTIDEAMNGVHYRIDDVHGHCDTCHGDGFVRLKQPTACPYCGGTGNSAYKDRGPLQIKIVCSHCEGSGKTTRRKCLECHGFGTKAGAGLVIDLPAGCLAGDSFVVENGFSNQDNNVIGDLELLIALKPDPRFRVLGRDIEMHLKLDVWEAVLGGKKDVHGPDGERYTFNVPRGTPQGRRIRLKDMGMRKNTDDAEKGDLIAVVFIQIPSGDDPKIKEAYERLRNDLTN